MTRFQRMSAVVSTHKRGALCDACVGDRLSLSREQVSVAGRAGARGLAFLRLLGRCSGCCTIRTVNRLR
jgi:hypothetical protein